MRSLSRVLLLLAAAGVVGHGDVPRPLQAARAAPTRETDTFDVAVPAHPFDVILGRPGASAVVLTVVAYEDSACWIAYGAEAKSAVRLPERPLPAGEPVSIALEGLAPDTAYRYELGIRPAKGVAPAVPAHGGFHTARPPGAAFTFTLTADAHLDGHTSAAVYLRTLANIAADRPDFHVDLGNLFMTDKHRTRAEAAAQYVAQRYYLGRIGGTTPILLALGTHDGESGRDDLGPGSLAPWARAMRTRYFPNPVADAFYSGNAAVAGEGPRQNFYAWTWGDALCVVLDPFSYTAPTRGAGDGWAWTLGRAQYDWLERTLRASRAPYKFVFVHNLLSGDAAARGGVEVAGFNEWGGRNRDGTEGFASHRPGWSEPVHALLVREHVTAVFKAHDNFYARQELDGIVYLMVPQPSFAGINRIRDLENYRYQRGVFLGNSGHVRVSVSAESVAIAYVSSADGRVLDAVTRAAGP